LVVKRKLLTNRVPSSPGGGTVAYVGLDGHRYLDDPVLREEGGTPAIIESIRAGMVFQLKESVGYEAIKQREQVFVERAIQRWGTNPDIRILGNPDAWRLSIVSFIVRHQKWYLHHNFVVALLNDLMGIQARGGCSCAGPYGHRLLGIDLTTSRAFEREIMRGCEGVKPGWVRVNFNYFVTDRFLEYVLDAIDMVAKHGWRLLPDYEFEPATGQWRHRAGRPEPPMRLTDLTYEGGRLAWRSRHAREPESVLPSYLEDARRVFEQAADRFSTLDISDPPLNEDFETLRWFPLPSEALKLLRGGLNDYPKGAPSSSPEPSSRGNTVVE
jgi:hypothetical protein